MKIGILTFSKAPNYGALLQTYALSKYLQDKGHEVILLSSNLVGQTGWKYKIRLNSVMYQFVVFQKKYLPSFVSASYDSSVDLYIVGSDQVWNPCLSEFPMAYFFDFLPITARKISYAASFGMDIWGNSPLTQKVTECLKSFYAISVRETSGVLICNDNFHQKAEKVLDPVFLLNDYGELTGNLYLKKMLISFQLGNNKEWGTVERFVSGKLNLGIKQLHSKKAISFLPSLRGFNRSYTSVQEWVKSIAESEFVVTDSFHAMVFALIYKKQFVVLPSIKSRMGRVTSLLTELGIDNRYYESISELMNTDEWMQPIDYYAVGKKIEQLKMSSLRFLDNSLLV